MAIFGKKNEVKVSEAEIPEELKPHLELRQHKEQTFASPQDLMQFKVEPQKPVYSQPTVHHIQMTPAQEPVHQPSPEPAKQEKTGFAPLFVKIDRYRNILKSLAEIKTTLALMKNAFVMLGEIDKIEDENMNVIANALDKIEKKMSALDAEFLRPSGFEDEMSETYEVESIQGVISDLHSQIRHLKNEIQQVQ